MSSLSASHAETEVHVVTTTTVATTADHVVMTTVAHAVTTEVQEVHVASVQLMLLSRTTTSQRCSKHH
jgi:hypothetical protein